MQLQSFARKGKGRYLRVRPCGPGSVCPTQESRDQTRDAPGDAGGHRGSRLRAFIVSLSPKGSKVHVKPQKAGTCTTPAANIARNLGAGRSGWRGLEMLQLPPLLPRAHRSARIAKSRAYFTSSPRDFPSTGSVRSTRPRWAQLRLPSHPGHSLLLGMEMPDLSCASTSAFSFPSPSPPQARICSPGCSSSQAALPRAPAPPVPGRPGTHGAEDARLFWRMRGSPAGCQHPRPGSPAAPGPLPAPSRGTDRSQRQSPGRRWRPQVPAPAPARCPGCSR